MNNWLDNVINAAGDFKNAVDKFTKDFAVHWAKAGEEINRDRHPIGPPPPPMPKPIGRQTNTEVYVDYLAEMINDIINNAESFELKTNKKIEILEKRISELEL